MKLVREHIYEKFTENGDPIKDMGIGSLHEIIQWINERKAYGSISSDERPEYILYYLLNVGEEPPAEYIHYMLQHYSHQELNVKKAIETAIAKGHLKIADILIDNGAKIQDITDKAKYILNLKGDKIQLTPKEKMRIVFLIRDFPKLLELIDDGVKITKGDINQLFDSPNNYIEKFDVKEKYKKYKTEHPKRFIEYLRERIKNNTLMDILDPKDHKKYDAIVNLLKKKELKHQNYPKGYKIYRILKYINENPGIRRTDIIKFAFELSHGKETFNPIINRGYWSDGFGALIYPNVDRDKNNRYTLNQRGKNRLAYYEKKFGNEKIIPEPYI